MAQDRVQFEVELTKYGITPQILIADIQDVPELRSRCELLTSDEQRLKLAVEWFGDRGEPQPKVRRNWKQGGFTPRVKNSDGTYRTPDWGRLPPLEELEVDGPPVEEPPVEERSKPRHRPPDEIPEATAKQLKWELAQREKRPDDPEFTQEKIAEKVGLHRTRVQQAEALERVGWDLLRTHPDFSALDGFVRWPSAEKAAQLLASERAEN